VIVEDEAMTQRDEARREDDRDDQQRMCGRPDGAG